MNLVSLFRYEYITKVLALQGGVSPPENAFSQLTLSRSPHVSRAASHEYGRRDTILCTWNAPVVSAQAGIIPSCLPLQPWLSVTECEVTTANRCVGRATDHAILEPRPLMRGKLKDNISGP
jgi:hypothetical protein